MRGLRLGGTPPLSEGVKGGVLAPLGANPHVQRRAGGIHLETMQTNRFRHAQVDSETLEKIGIFDRDGAGENLGMYSRIEQEPRNVFTD